MKTWAWCLVPCLLFAATLIVNARDLEVLCSVCPEDFEEGDKEILMAYFCRRHCPEFAAVYTGFFLTVNCDNPNVTPKNKEICLIEKQFDTQQSQKSTWGYWEYMTSFFSGSEQRNEAPKTKSAWFELVQFFCGKQGAEDLENTTIDLFAQAGALMTDAQNITIVVFLIILVIGIAIYFMFAYTSIRAAVDKMEFMYVSLGVALGVFAKIFSYYLPDLELAQTASKMCFQLSAFMTLTWLMVKVVFWMVSSAWESSMEKKPFAQPSAVKKEENPTSSALGLQPPGEQKSIHVTYNIGQIGSGAHVGFGGSSPVHPSLLTASNPLSMLEDKKPVDCLQTLETASGQIESGNHRGLGAPNPANHLLLTDSNPRLKIEDTQPVDPSQTLQPVPDGNNKRKLENGNQNEQTKRPREEFVAGMDMEVSDPVVPASASDQSKRANTPPLPSALVKPAKGRPVRVRKPCTIPDLNNRQIAIKDKRTLVNLLTDLKKNNPTLDIEDNLSLEQMDRCALVKKVQDALKTLKTSKALKSPK